MQLNNENILQNVSYLDCGIIQITLDNSRRHQQKFMHCLLHSSIVAAFCNGNGCILSSSSTSRCIGWTGCCQEREQRCTCCSSSCEEVPPLEDVIIICVRLQGQLGFRLRDGRRRVRREAMGASDGCKEEGDDAKLGHGWVVLLPNWMTIQAKKKEDAYDTCKD